MKELKRQDKNGVRTAADLERRYKFKDIELTADEVDELKKLIEVDSFLSTSSIHPVQNKVITEALNSKVNKEAGKGLSTNDFTNVLYDKLIDIPYNAEENVIESISVNGKAQTITDKKVDLQIKDSFTDDYKQQIEDNTELRHIHNNMTLLQSYEQTEDNLRDAVSKRHTHSNKSLLDSYTQTEANLASAVSSKHTHSNKALLDTYTQTNANIASAVTNNHTHSNKSVLDGITSTLISNWNNAASNAHSASITSGTNTNTIRLGKVLIQSGRVSAKVTTGGTAIQLSFNFPVAFKNAPTLLMQPSTSAPNSIWVTTSESTTTQGKYWFYRPNTSATIIEWLAIGEGV